MADLATIAANRITPTEASLGGFTPTTTATTLQRRARQRRTLELLGVWHHLGYAQSVDRPTPARHGCSGLAPLHQGGTSG